MRARHAGPAIILGLVFSLTLGIGAGGAAGGPPASAPGAAYAPDQVLIQYVAGASEAQKQQARARAGATRREVVVPATAGQGELELATLPPGRAVADAARSIAADSAVAFAEPNWLYTHDAASNDTYFTNGSLWGMYGDAAGAPTNAFGSQAEEAWAANHTGSRSVYVGVIDEGIDYNHRDLAGNIWTNPYDPIDGVDNDLNGYVDDVHGWDFYGNNNSIFDPRNKKDKSTDAHGTHVSGTIGALGGNGTGVAGVNWNVTIISAKFLGPNGGYTSDAVEAVNYLVNLKLLHPQVNIVALNNSWGGGGYSQALWNAIDYANRNNILFVAAAGNSGLNIDSSISYPAGYDNTNILSVAAIDSTGGLASWSNYGATRVDLGAPGVGIWSTTPQNGYSSYSGTSMATPHVTGAAALYASTHPGSTDELIRDAILNSGVPTSSLTNKTATGDRLNVSGF